MVCWNDSCGWTTALPLASLGKSTERCRLVSQSMFDVVYLAVKTIIIACTDLCGFDLKQLVLFREGSRACVEIWQVVDVSIADLPYDSGYRRQILRRQLSNRDEKMGIKYDRSAWRWSLKWFMLEWSPRRSAISNCSCGPKRQPKNIPSVYERKFGNLVIEAEGRKDVLFGFWLKMEYLSEEARQVVMIMESPMSGKQPQIFQIDALDANLLVRHSRLDFRFDFADKVLHLAAVSIGL